MPACCRASQAIRGAFESFVKRKQAERARATMAGVVLTRARTTDMDGESSHGGSELGDRLSIASWAAEPEAVNTPEGTAGSGLRSSAAAAGGGSARGMGARARSTEALPPSGARVGQRAGAAAAAPPPAASFDYSPF